MYVRANKEQRDELIRLAIPNGFTLSPKKCRNTGAFVFLSTVV